MKRTNSESNRDQRPLLAGLQPLSTTTPSTSTTASKRNRKYTNDTFDPVPPFDSEDINGDVIVDDDDDDEDSPTTPTLPIISSPESLKLEFNPIKKPSRTIFVDGLSQSMGLPRGSVPHPNPLDDTTESMRPIFELKKLSIHNLKPKRDWQKGAVTTTALAQDPDDVSSKNSISILLAAIRTITSDPLASTSLNLKILADTCEGLVYHSPSTCGSLYEKVYEEFEIKAKSLRAKFVSGLPVQPSLSATDTISPDSDSPDIIRYITKLDDTKSLPWLKNLQLEWQNWLDQLLMIRGILIHLDRTVLIRCDHIDPLWELGLKLFRNEAFRTHVDDVSLSLAAVICEQINHERSRKPIPHGLIQLVCNLLRTTFHPETFEKMIMGPFVRATDAFYHEEGDRLINEVNSEILPVGGPQGYLRHCLSRIEEENERMAKLFTTSDRSINKQTEMVLVQHTKTNLILRHLEVLLQKGFGKMLDAFPEPESSQSIRDMYRVLQNLGKEPSQRLRLAFLSWMKEVGSTIVGVGSASNEERRKEDEEMVQNLINFKNKVDKITRTCFEAEREMFHAIREAFEVFINKRDNKPAELIAKYLDQKLRQGNRFMTDGEMDQCMNEVLILFRYTQGKDIFEEFYKRDLSKRLLLLKSASIDTERNMVMKLKEECGAGFTAKLETMFRDIETSVDVNSAYHTMLTKARGSSDQLGSLELSVSVLTAGSWPTSHTPEANLVLPPNMSSHLTRFEQFYQSKHLGRRLKWNHSLGQWVISATFPGPGKGCDKELSVSTYQGLVLLLFNELAIDSTIGFDTILQRTGLSSKEAARTLQSLACGRVRVLVKIPKGKEVDETDRFGFNAEFKHDNFKIRINQIQSKETDVERKSTTAKVVTERSTLLQLSVVRIMKARKNIKHAELVLETINQLKQRFKVEPREIKVAVESLIARDYMERVDGTMDEYHYIA